MRNLKTININSIWFLDIETVPSWPTFNDAPEHVQKEWVYKFKFRPEAPSLPDPEKNINNDQPYFQEKYIKYFRDLWDKEAGLYPEFARIICISTAYIAGDTLRMKSYANIDEAVLLTDWRNDCQQFNNAVKFMRICGHYSSEFDLQFIVKRLIIHSQPIPPIIDEYGLKPWESVNLDTQKIWKIGSFRASATMSSIAMALGIPTPKDDIEGSDVARVFYQDKDLNRIVLYCEKDVVTLAQIFKRLRYEALIDPDKIVVTR